MDNTVDTTVDKMIINVSGMTDDSSSDSTDVDLQEIKMLDDDLYI